MVANALFSAGISGLRAQSEAFASISQNVANLTTNGYKNTETLFSDLVHSGTGSIFEQFSGANPNTRNLIASQGSIISTGRALDVAIDGTGFLVTNTLQDGSGDTLLTRAGSLDRLIVGSGTAQQAFLVDQNGNFIQGFPSDGAGGFSVSSTLGGLQPIRVDRGAVLSAATATTTASVAANLPANAATGVNFDLRAQPETKCVVSNACETHCHTSGHSRENGNPDLSGKLGCLRLWTPAFASVTVAILDSNLLKLHT